MLKEGEFRLRWDDKRRMHLYQDFPTVNDALTHAAILFAKGEVSSFTALENWLGEHACPPEQLMPIARMRTKAALNQYDREKSQAQLERTPGYGTF